MRGFRRKSTDVSGPPTTSAPSASLSQTAGESQGGQRPPAFVPQNMDHVTSVEHLFQVPALTRLFTCGLVLIHNKRPAADRLITLAMKALTDVAQFKHVHASATKTGNTLPDPGVRTSTARRRRVLVVNADRATHDIASVVDRYAAVRPRKGLWVRGNIDELRPATMRQFDLLFLFDMPAEHMDRIRSIVPVPPRAEIELRESITANEPTGKVFVVLTADEIGSDRLPRLPPTIVPLYRGDDRPALSYPVS